MSASPVHLTAPNGTEITLPTGLFINNEFVKSSSGSKITSINPRSVAPKLVSFIGFTDFLSATRVKLLLWKLRQPKMSTKLCVLLELR